MSRTSSPLGTLTVSFQARKGSGMPLRSGIWNRKPLDEPEAAAAPGASMQGHGEVAVALHIEPAEVVYLQVAGHRAILADVKGSGRVHVERHIPLPLAPILRFGIVIPVAIHRRTIPVP